MGIHRKNFLAGLAFLAVTGFVAGYLITYRGNARPGERVVPPPGPNGGSPKPHLTQVSSPVVVISPKTQFVYRTTYFCGDTEEQVTPAPIQFHGLNLEQFRLAYPQWTVITFNSDKVELATESDQYCPEMQVWRTVGVSNDGYLTIYLGRKGRPDKLVKEKTAIRVSELPLEDQRKLAEGLEFQGDEAVKLFLESDR